MTYRVVVATTQTLIALLDSHLAADPLLAPDFNAGAGGDMRVWPRTPQEMGQFGSRGISVWLYQICRDPDQLNHPPPRPAEDRVRRHPLPLRLHYLITPVVQAREEAANDPGMEQLLIGKVLQTFHDHARLTGSLLQGDLIGTGATLTARLEALNLEEITRVWDALQSPYQLCLSYEVTVALVASDTQPRNLTTVQSVEPEHGVMREVAGP